LAVPRCAVHQGGASAHLARRCSTVSPYRDFSFRCSSRAGSGTTSSSAVSSHTGQAVSGATINVAGDAPVDVEIRIDRTAILHGNRALANAYKSAARRAADITITRGGTLSVVLFGETSSHSLEIFPSTEIAALEDKGHAARGADNKNYRIRLASALDLAVGLRAAEGLDREELKRLTARPGSDVIRAAAHGLDELPTDLLNG